MKYFFLVACLVGTFLPLPRAHASAESILIREGLTTDDSLSEYEFRLMGLQDSNVGNGSSDFGTLTEYTADWDWGLVYLKDVVGGDIDVRLRTALTVMDDGGGADLPGQVGYLTASAGWLLGNKEDLSCELRAAPGIYSDWQELSTEAFAVPFSFAFRKVLDSDLSAILGMQIRPRFLDQIMPIAGVVWDPSEPVRIAFCLPESRATWQPNRTFRTYIGFEWENMSYDLHDEYDQITKEDFLLDVGVAVDVGAAAALELELGRMMNRTLEYDNYGSMANDQLEVDSAMFVRFGFFGPL